MKKRADGWWMRHYQVDVRHSRAFGALTRHLVIQKRSGLDGITWDVLQAIKDDVLGQDVIAVEMYPRACDMVYEVNARHLWEVPADFETKMPTLLLR